ncbi:tyrosine-type recombinase/integrase [Gordonia sp. CPCC 205333]|uniref:tyrosine-type recombinase/integrase n=1 Tax=Gordonia sp. CPCC 205333 TaxID=3140790 RepID=UPI003AF3AE9F
MELPKKVNRRKVYLSHDQLHRFADEVGKTAIDAAKRATLVLTLGYCGPRWGEATALKVRDFNALRHRFLFQDNAVEVDGEIREGSTKGGDERTAPISTFLVDAIAKVCEGKGPDDLIFDHPDGGFLLLPPYERGWWQQSVKGAGIPRITPHDLRHTAASLAVQAGANVKALQRMPGHKRATETLDIYADLFDDDLEGIADRLDEAAGRMWAKRAK